MNKKLELKNRQSTYHCVFCAVDIRNVGGSGGGGGDFFFRFLFSLYSVHSKKHIDLLCNFSNDE